MKISTLFPVLVILFIGSNSPLKADPAPRSGSVVIVMDSPIKGDPTGEKPAQADKDKEEKSITAKPKKQQKPKEEKPVH